MKLLFIGLDAFDPGILRDGIARGVFPALAAIASRAVSVETGSDPGTYVGSIWATIHTGVGPGEHGIYSWCELRPGTYELRMSDERHMPVPSFWTRLSDAGYRSIVVDMPHCKLDPDIGGTHVVNWLTHFKTQQGFVTAPPDLAGELERRFGLDPYPHCNHVGRGREELVDFTDAMIHRIEWRTAFMLEEISRKTYDVGALTFGESHCAGHQLFHLHDPAGDADAAAIGTALGDPMMRVYCAIDEAIGRLVAAVPGDCTIVILASHGMGPHYDGSHLADHLLRRADRALSGFPPVPIRRRLVDLVEANRLRRHLGPLAKLLPPEQPRRAHARAFTVPNNEAYLGIRINLEGREPAGLVRRQDYDRFVGALEAMLMETRRTSDGTRAFTHATRADRTYGVDPRGSGLPDLMLGWDREQPFQGLEIAGVVRIDGDSPSVRTGDHREGGVLFLAGPPGRTANLPAQLASRDIAGVILGHFGLATSATPAVFAPGGPASG